VRARMEVGMAARVAGAEEAARRLQAV
jgi:hypothetical protein